VTSSAVFVGTARDCAKFLPRALECWERLATVFEAASFIVAENNSNDGTKAVLSQWAASGAGRHFLCLDGIGEGLRNRSEVLAAARNSLLDAVRSDPAFSSAQWLIVMDLDDASLALTPRRLARCMEFAGWDALFANQLFIYYDVWALRSSRSPDDFATLLDSAPEGWRRKLARLVHLTWRSRPIPPWRKPIRVTSAFGGFGVYRMQIALSGRYSGWRDGRPVCEHVPFHQQLESAGARLFIHPRLINAMPELLMRVQDRWLPGHAISARRARQQPARR
jgi:hypothetical protein